jgi:hypothetical protein
VNIIQRQLGNTDLGDDLDLSTRHRTQRGHRRRPIPTATNDLRHRGPRALTTHRPVSSNRTLEDGTDRPLAPALGVKARIAGAAATPPPGRRGDTLRPGPCQACFRALRRLGVGCQWRASLSRLLVAISRVWARPRSRGRGWRGPRGVGRGR